MYRGRDYTGEENPGHTQGHVPDRLQGPGPGLGLGLGPDPIARGKAGDTSENEETISLIVIVGFGSFLNFLDSQGSFLSGSVLHEITSCMPTRSPTIFVTSPSIKNVYTHGHEGIFSMGKDLL